jgi:hypothetical protein
MKVVISWINDDKFDKHHTIPQDLSRRTVYTREMARENGARENGWVE